MSLTGVPDGENKESGREITLKKILMDDFAELKNRTPRIRNHNTSQADK